MSTWYDYTVLRLVPDASRGERLNIGIAVFRPNNMVDLWLTPHLNKVRALGGAIDLDALRRLPENTLPVLNQLGDRALQQHFLENFLGIIQADPQLGKFVAANEKEYDARVKLVLDSLVTPMAIPAGVRSRSKLHRQLKDWFEGAKLLGTQPEDVYRNKIVTRYPISTADQLYAEFALKNGVFHVIETVDFRGIGHNLNSNKFREATMKAVVLDQASDALGADTRKYVVVAATDYRPVGGALNILGKYSHDVLHFESDEDMKYLVNRVAEATHRQELAQLSEHWGSW